MAPKVDLIIIDGTDSENDALPEVQGDGGDSSSDGSDSSTEGMVGFDGDSSSDSSSEDESMDSSSTEKGESMEEDESSEAVESSEDEDVCICETCIWERQHNMIVRGVFSVLICSFDASYCST